MITMNMKIFRKLRFLLILLSTALSTSAFASVGGGEGVRQRWRLLPADYAGSMKLCSLGGEATHGIWPDSLQPVYIARVARHGARYISSKSKLEPLRRAIDDARREHKLTKTGERFALLLNEVDSLTGNHWGELSDVGKNEENAMGANLFGLLPELLRDAKATAIATYVPRVVMTMYEFCHQLALQSHGIEISTSEGHQWDCLLRSFSTDSTYAQWRQSGAWKDVVESFTDSIVSPAPARRMFGAGLTAKKGRKLTLAIYGLLQSLEAMGLPAPTDEFMSEKEYEACWQTDNLTHYLRNTVNAMSAAAARATTPLLQRIISNAEAALENPGPAEANFYFGHAETLMPLLSLMEVEGSCNMTTDFAHIGAYWKDYDVVPLGASLDIILLSGASGEIYAALRHNGKFIPPIEGGEMIIPWETYRSHLDSLISKWNNE